MNDSERGDFLKEALTFSAIAILIVLPVRLFIAQPFVVSGASMDPTFHDGEYLIVDELSYHIGEPERGDVVIFKYPKDPSKYFIKRVIGLPGEVVHIRESSVDITDAGGKDTVLSEPYLVNQGNGPGEDMTLGPDQYFVMGDNRPASSDSRFWGTVPRDNMVGRALFRLLPLSRIALFPGSIASFTNSQ
jgi:signal peptidase I